MKALKQTGILLLVTLGVFLGAEFFFGKQSAKDDASETARYYKELSEHLESELASVKQEQYAALAVYREQVAALQDQLAENRDTYAYKVENGKAVLTGYAGTKTTLSLPSQIDGMAVISLGKESFRNSAVEAVILPDGLECIGWFAFSGCRNLKSITIPTSVRSIEYGAFDGCPSLTVYCASGSFAEKYAKSYGFSVVSQ